MSTLDPFRAFVEKRLEQMRVEYRAWKRLLREHDSRFATPVTPACHDESSGARKRDHDNQRGNGSSARNEAKPNGLPTDLSNPPLQNRDRR